MKSTKVIGIVSSKRLLVLVLCSVTSIFLIKGLFAQGTAQSNESQAQERKLKIKDFADMPVVVREVRNLQSKTWHKDLEIEVKNVSDKPIYFILAYLIFPDDKATNGEVGVRLTYGTPENIRIRRIADSKDLHLDPGETYVFTVPVMFRKGFEARHKKYTGLDKNLLLRFALISFGDGTGFEVGEPRDLRLKKSSSLEATESHTLKKSPALPST